MQSQVIAAPIIKLPPYGSQKRGLDEQEEAKYQLTIQQLQLEIERVT